MLIASTVSASNGGARPEPTSTETAIAEPTPTETASLSVAAGSSPWNAANVFGGITAITGLIAALTGLATLRASRHQVPATVYVMAAQPPVTPPGAAPMSPGAGPVPGLSKPKATDVGPAEAHGTGENNQAP